MSSTVIGNQTIGAVERRYMKTLYANEGCILSSMQSCYQEDEADTMIHQICKIRLQFSNCPPLEALSTFCDPMHYHYRKRPEYVLKCSSYRMRGPITAIEGYVERDQTVYADYPTGFKLYYKDGKVQSFG